MRTKRRALMWSLLGTIVLLVAVLWRPAQIWFHLYQLRSDETTALRAVRSACELGMSVREPLLGAVSAYAGESGVGHFRPAAVRLFMCLREGERSESSAEYLGADEEAVDAMLELHRQASSPAARADIEWHFRHSDELTYLRLWRGMAKRGQPSLEIPRAENMHPSPCGDAFPGDPRAPTLWCEGVGPALRALLAEDVLTPRERVLVERRVGRSCPNANALALEAQRSHGEMSQERLEEIMNRIYADPETQHLVLTSLVEASAACEWQRRLHRSLEVRRPHVPASVARLRRWVAEADDVCVAELFSESSEENRRAQMARSLGVAHE